MILHNLTLCCMQQLTKVFWRKKEIKLTLWHMTRTKVQILTLSLALILLHFTLVVWVGVRRRSSSVVHCALHVKPSFWTASGSFLTRCIFKTVPVEEADRKLYKKSVNNVWINCEKLCIYTPRKMAGKLVYTNNDSNSNNGV